MGVPRETASRFVHSVGKTMRLVTISGITADGKTAIVTDRSGFEARVSLLTMPAKGVLPAIGENWYIDQSSGTWTFSAFVGSSVAQLAQQIGQPPAPPSGTTAPTAILQQASTMTATAGGTSTVPGSNVIGSSSVLTLNPYFTNGDLTGWQPYNGSVATTQIPVGPYPWSAKIIAGSTLNFGLQATNSNTFNVLINTQYLITGWIYINGGQNPFAEIGVDWMNAAFVVQSSSITDISVPVNVWTPISAVVSTANGAVTKARVRAGAASSTGKGMQVYIEALMALPQVPGGLIQAGTITAAQIAAGTIKAGIVDGTTIMGATIIADGPSGELLVYSASPIAKGNLILSVSAVAASDSVGNNFGQGINVGTWSASTGNQLQHLGVDNAGRVYTVGPDGVTRILINNGTSGVGPDLRFYNDFGAVLMVVDPNAGGQFQYQDKGSSTQGPLIGSQSSKNTTDPVNGGAVNAGITIVDPVFGDFLTAVGANIGLGQVAFTQIGKVTANTGSGATNPFIQVEAPEQGVSGHFQMRMYGTSPDGTVPGGVAFGEVATGGAITRIANTIAEIQGSLTLTGIAIPAAPPAGNAFLFSDTSGVLRHNIGVAGDTQNYFMAHAVISATAVPQTVATTTFTTVTGCSHSVGIGHYAFRARITYDGGTAAGTMKVQFAAPATSSRWMNALFLNNSGAGFGDAQNAALSFVTSPVLDTNPRDVADIEGDAVFTAAGTLSLQVAEGTSGDTVIVQQAHFWLYPLQ